MKEEHTILKKLKNKILIFATGFVLGACALMSNDTQAADDSITIKCNNAVDRGMIILDNPPMMNCKDLNLVNMFVGTGLVIGPVSNIDALADNLKEAAKQLEDQQANNQNQFHAKKQIAFKELDATN